MNEEVNCMVFLLPDTGMSETCERIRVNICRAIMLPSHMLDSTDSNIARDLELVRPITYRTDTLNERFVKNEL